MTELFHDLFIFDMANNHQGQVEHGLRIIREIAKIARRHGIRAGVKFQYRHLDSLIHPTFRDRQDVKHIPRFLSTALSTDQFQTLIGAVRDEDLLAIVTPFDEPSVAQCISHGVDILKVASCSAMDWPLLEEIANTGRPVIVSSGGVSLHEIDSLVSFFTHKETEFALMHCVGVYPTPNQMLHMRFISRMRKRYPGVAVGWSGHEAPDNLDPVKIAVAMGAELLERHVGLPTDQIKLNKYSMSPQEVDAWVAAALTARTICGNSEKQITQDEIESLGSLKRGVFAKRAIKQGETISPDDVFFAMPWTEGQTTSGEFGRYRVTFTASQDYQEKEPIREYCQTDPITRLRSIVHDIKGMIYEAQLTLGNDFQIELSHHDGIEQFRRTGAAIINVVNRDYCKKLVVTLPGQNHPPHAHKIKEETFQLLWGDLEVTLNGTTVRMEPGDKMLVEPGQMHSFRSSGGGIFEEISTKHFTNDSYYADERINKMDLLERKTVLENW